MAHALHYILQKPEYPQMQQLKTGEAYINFADTLRSKATDSDHFATHRQPKSTSYHPPISI